jgi:SAM-dependent methyltransferase
LCKSPATLPRPGYQHIAPGDWSLHLCSDCGTSFIFPVPDKKRLAAAYDKDYYGTGDGKFVGPVENIVRFFRYARAKSIQKLVPPGRILDVGCGRGLMLTFLKRWGYEVHGIELDTVAALRAEKNLGQKVFRSLEQVARPSPWPYQAICFWHSLEHMPEPGDALKIAYELLAPEGILVIAAPNMESMQSRLAGTDWLHLDLPRHVVHFDMTRLASYLHNRGYDILRHDHFSQEYNVIDTLCLLFKFLGFHPLHPFNLIRHAAESRPRSRCRIIASTAQYALVVPMTVVAFLVANAFSLFKTGSTTTLFLKKRQISRIPVAAT